MEHQHPIIMLNPLPVPQWKSEVISLDFIIGYPQPKRQHDSLMGLVDTLKKSEGISY